MNQIKLAPLPKREVKMYKRPRIYGKAQHKRIKKACFKGAKSFFKSLGRCIYKTLVFLTFLYLGSLGVGCSFKFALIISCLLLFFNQVNKVMG